PSHPHRRDPAGPAHGERRLWAPRARDHGGAGAALLPRPVPRGGGPRGGGLQGEEDLDPPARVSGGVHRTGARRLGPGRLRRMNIRLLKLHEAAPTPAAGPAQPARHHLRPWLVGLLAALVVVAAGTAVDYRLQARLAPPPLVFLAPVTRGPV